MLPSPRPPGRALRWRICLAGLVLGLLPAGALLSGAALARPLSAAEPAAAGAGPAAPTIQDPVFGPVVGRALRHDLSPALRDLRALPGPGSPEAADVVLLIDRVLPNRLGDPAYLDALKAGGVDYLAVDDPVIQPQLGAGGLPSPEFNFEGINNRNSLVPPDPVGDVGVDPATGRRYYMQWVNTSFQIWDVTNPPTVTSVLGPFNGNSLWAGFGGACQAQNSGDPIVLFDQLANRWLASQFAVDSAPYHQCIAISQTADPTGAWHRYAFELSDTKFNDYPHFGVWPDGYYLSVNQFVGLDWAGAAAVVFERDQMLAGLPARFVYFDLFGVDPNFGGQLPADLDGLDPPPAGAPNLFVEVDDNIAVPGLGPADALRLWEFSVDWAAPENATFGLAGQPNAVLPVDSFSVMPCLFQPPGRNCVPQPAVGGSTHLLDAVGDRIMHRLAYRNFGTHAALVLNHTVDAGGARAGVRWYEVRNPGTAPAIYQQGTFAPADTAHRWMASIAMDHQGNSLLGYSASGPSLYPSLRVTGRLAGDAPGLMTLGEGSLWEGAGAQVGSNRWGDYTSLTVDPVDDCTFWYTNQYYSANSTAAWRTRIVSLRLPSCWIGPQGRLQGEVTALDTLQPIAGALVQAAAPTQTVDLYTSLSGRYGAWLAAGPYTVTAAAYGYQAAGIPGVSVISGTTTTVDLALAPAPSFVISGAVTDAGAGLPLWATVSVAGEPFDPPITSLQTDPATGFYSLTIAGGGQAYTLTASALLHTPLVRSLGVAGANRTEDFALAAASSSGGLAGYVRNAYTRQPVAGALVTVTAGGAPSATTDSLGYYQFLGLAPGSYTATASAPFYSPAMAPGLLITAGVAAYQAFDLLTSRLSFAPAAISRTLEQGQAVTDPAGLVLTNTGASALTFELIEQQGGYLPAGAQVPAGGGPDAFGYTWRSSAEPGGPPFAWIDAAGGTALNLGDDGAANLTLPFPFTLYTTTANALRVSNNGLAVFNAASSGLLYQNAPLTSTDLAAVPNDLLAPLWDDLDNETGNVYWTVTGAAPNRRVVIEWHDRPHWQFGGGLGSATFEMALFEDGDILFQYLDVDFGDSDFDAGASASVGIRGPSPVHALQYSFNEPDLAGGLGLCFDYPGSSTACGFGEALPWLAVSPTAGTLPGGVSATQPIELRWTAPISLPGRYSGALWIGNNDPVAQPAIVPLTLNLLAAPSAQFAGAAFAAPEGAPSAPISVTLSVVPTHTVTVDYATAAGSAAPGSDYLEASGTLTFTPGLTLTALLVPLLDDAVPEGPETVLISLSNPSDYIVGPTGAATLTILDDEPLPVARFAGSAQTVAEGAAAAVTLTLQPASALTVSVPFSVAGTATGGGVDHTLAAGAFVLAPGQVTATAPFSVVADLWFEAGETIVVSLGLPAYAVLGSPAVHTITLLEAAPASRLYFPELKHTP